MRGTGSCDNHALENELRDKGEVLSQTAELKKCKMFAESFLESDAVQTKAFLSRILSPQSCALAWCRSVYVFPFFRCSLLRRRAFQVLPLNFMSAASLPEPRLEP